MVAEPESDSGLFDDRQQRYLTGRTVTRTILDGQGNVLAESGQTITPEMIESVKRGGRMVQLALHNRP